MLNMVDIPRSLRGFSSRGDIEVVSPARSGLVAVNKGPHTLPGPGTIVTGGMFAERNVRKEIFIGESWQLFADEPMERTWTTLSSQCARLLSKSTSALSET
jgi:hypothetical protein